MSPIRSVLVAGMHTDGNQYVRYLEDLMLKWEHMPEIRNGHVPTGHDAVIIAASMASHTLFEEVRDAYTALEKPVFLSKKGISDIREKFELLVFGGMENVRILRCPLDADESIPIPYRLWWILARLLSPGDEIRLKAFYRFAEKFLLKGHKAAVGNVWYRGRQEGIFLESGKGRSVFRGIPDDIAAKLAEYNLIIGDGNMKPNVVIRSKARESFEEVFRPVSVPMEESQKEETREESVTEESQAMMQLLLEAMAQTQAEIKQLREFINVRVPEMLKIEMAGVNSVVKSIQPKLAELSPEQLKTIDSMIDLMLSAYAGGRS